MRFFKSHSRPVAWAQLLGWGACLTLAACNAIAPGGLDAFKPAETPTSPPTSTPAPSVTPSPQLSTITPSATNIPSPTFAPTETRQPVPQILTPKNVSGLKILAQRNYAPNELITAVAWSPDGGRLAVAAGENILWLDSISLHELRLLPIRALSRSLAFSPEGTLLAAGSQDGIVRLWQTQALDQPSGSSSPVLSLQAHKKGVNQVAFHPTRPLLASGGNDAIARIWDLNSGKQLSQTIGGTFAVPGLAFSPDGAYLAVMNGTVIRLRYVDSGRMVATLRADTDLFCLAFSPSGDELVAGDNAGSLWIWKLDGIGVAGNEPPQPQRLDTGAIGGGQAGLVWQVAFNPDGAMLGIALGDGSLQLWDARSGERIWAAHAADSAITSLAFSPDGRWLASGSLDARLRLWGAIP